MCIANTRGSLLTLTWDEAQQLATIAHVSDLYPDSREQPLERSEADF
jgi:hypothetical protein